MELLPILEYEFKRMRMKKSFYLLMALAVLPLVVSVIVEGLSPGALRDVDDLWAMLLGVSIHVETTAGVVTAVSPAGMTFIVGLLFGSDLLVAEIEDGSVAYLASRGVSRAEIVLGKTVSLLVLMMAYSAVCVVSSIAGSLLAGGGLKYLEYAPLVWVALGIETFAFALLAAFSGVVTGRMLRGAVLAFFLYSGIGSLPAALILAMGGEQDIDLLAKVSALTPIRNFGNLAGNTYQAVTGASPGSIGGVEVRLGEYLPYQLVSVSATLAILLAAAYLLYKRRDF